MEEFEDYLKRKKIDPVGFKHNEPQKYKEFLGIFNEVHPESFTAQKLFLINKIRRQYPFFESEK